MYNVIERDQVLLYSTIHFTIYIIVSIIYRLRHNCTIGYTVASFDGVYCIVIKSNSVVMNRNIIYTYLDTE